VRKELVAIQTSRCFTRRRTLLDDRAVSTPEKRRI